jgi:hypothetical protein
VWWKLSRLLGDFLRLHGFDHCHLLLLLLEVALLVLEAVFDDPLDDLFCGDGAAGVDGDEFLQDLRDGVGVAVFWRNRRLSVHHDVDVELIDELVGDVEGCADHNFIDVLKGGSGQ